VAGARGRGPERAGRARGDRRGGSAGRPARLRRPLRERAAGRPAADPERGSSVVAGSGRTREASAASETLASATLAASTNVPRRIWVTPWLASRSRYAARNPPAPH